MSERKINTRLLISSLAAMIIFGVFAIFFWDLLRENIVLPLYRFWILFRYGVNSVSQVLILFLALAGGVILVIRALDITFKQDVVEKQNGFGGLDFYAGDYSSRYRFWRMVTTPLYHSQFARNDFMRNSRRIILELIAHQQHRSWEEVETMVMQNQIQLPPLIDELVRERTLRCTFRQKTALQEYFEGIARRLGLIHDLPDPILDEHINAILQFIEERLEITHDESNL